jgi:hypothetical protein
MSVRLDAYLDLERAMRALDDVGDPTADALRDALDPIWYALTDDERAFLNQRAIAPGPVYGIRVALDATFFAVVLIPSPPSTEPATPVRIVDWEYAA